MEELQNQQKSKLELVISAFFYELIGATLVSLLIVFATNEKFGNTLVLSAMLSCIALIWNMVYNAIFDRFLMKKRGNIVKTKGDRILHVIGFEIIFAFFALTTIMLYKGIGLKAAFQMELYFLIFFFVYTFAYTYVYDQLRVVFLKKFGKVKN